MGLLRKSIHVILPPVPINYWHSWLRHCATCRKVVGSLPDGVIGIFHWPHPSALTMNLRSTQPLTEISTRNISWVSKGGRFVRLTTLPPSRADCLEIWEPQLPGTLWPVQGLLYPSAHKLHITIWYIKCTHNSPSHSDSLKSLQCWPYLKQMTHFCNNWRSQVGHSCRVTYNKNF